MKRIIITIILLCQILWAAPFGKGDTLPVLTWKNQFDRQVSVGKDARVLIMAFEKDVAVETAKVLTRAPKGVLERHRAYYISDISSMPSVITSWFALPKMKKYPFEVLLIRQKEEGEKFLHQQGKITLYRLKRGNVISVEYMAPKRLEKVLEQL